MGHAVATTGNSVQRGSQYARHNLANTMPDIPHTCCQNYTGRGNAGSVPSSAYCRKMAARSVARDSITAAPLHSVNVRASCRALQLSVLRPRRTCYHPPSDYISNTLLKKTKNPTKNPREREKKNHNRKRKKPAAKQKRKIWRNCCPSKCRNSTINRGDSASRAALISPPRSPSKR